VYRGGTPIATVSGTSHTDTGLGDGATHSYTVRANNNFNTQYSLQTGSVTATTQVDCTTFNFPDLEADLVSILIGPANNVDGIWENSNSRLTIGNLGPISVLRAASSTPYRSTVDLENNGSVDLDSGVDYESGVIAVGGTSGLILQSIGNVPFGTHEICLRVNLDGTTIQESNADTSNNSRCITQDIDVPAPPMSITTDQDLIRSGESVTISWSAQTSYPLNCEVSGAGNIRTQTGAVFNASSNGGGVVSGSYTIPALSNSSEFVIQCTEPTTSTSFTETVNVEVVPDFEEF
jgi:hypothetical protein